MDILDAQKSKARDGGPSFTLRNRLFRGAWNVVWLLAGSWTPVPMHAWRRWLVRLFGGKVDSTARIYPHTRIWYPPHLQMAPYSCIGPRVIVYCMATISLGRHAVVSQGAHLCTGSHDVDDAHFQLTARPITIGAGAWVAAEGFVGPGVTIGDGAVLGARGVVFRDIEPRAIAIGNPARFLRMRHIGEEAADIRS